MGSMDLAIRFTEEKYCSKADVIRELKTSLVDNIWANILEYRKGLFRPIDLLNIDKHEFNICNCNCLLSKTTNLEMKLFRLLKEYDGCAEDSYNSLELFSYINCLKPICRNIKLSDNESSIRMIIKGEVKADNEDYIFITNYVKCLNYIKNNYVNAPEIETLLVFYKTLMNNSEVSFRSREDNDPNNRTVINRIYTSAPHALIESMLENLFSFIKSSQFSSVIKASVAYYYINLVKPFDYYSEEISVLLAKYILANESMGPCAVLLPLENILDSSNDEIAKIFNECQRYSDVTYFILYGLDALHSICDELLVYLHNNKFDPIQEEFNQPEVEELVEKVIEQNKVEEPKVEKIIISHQEKVTKAEEPVVQPTNERLAVNFVPSEITDREAARLANHLLELDPCLKKNEAYFYAKHCTLGKKYTIQQFKKSIGCAYETARTSMDHLAELGYYRKEAIKNKFVYSPIAR